VVAEWSTCLLTTRVIVRCSEIEIHWYRDNYLHLNLGGTDLRLETGYAEVSLLFLGRSRQM
jgi:hypothetical protein